MSDFCKFSAAVHARYEELVKGELHVTDVGDIFKYYLASFPEGTNPVHKERTEYDCNTCKQFIRRLGHVVSIDAAGNISSVWDVENVELPYPYNEVAASMAAYVKAAKPIGVFRSKERQFGCEHTFAAADGTKWYHFHGKVGNNHYTLLPDKVAGELNANAQVFERGLAEFNLETVDDLLDLINTPGGLYRGEEHKPALEAFKKLATDYKSAANQQGYVWAHCNDFGARIRNTVIGTLLQDLSNGLELDAAVRKFESKVAPTNYKRPTAVITPKMIDAALTTLENLGLRDAIKRRFAKKSDVSVNDVLWVDNAVKGKMRDGLANLLMQEVKPKAPQSLKDATPITGEEFFNDVVPKAKSLQVLLENKHLSNFVSLTAPEEDIDERLFKWNNNYAWAYVGDVTDAIKERVKQAGGNVQAKFRVSLAWFNRDDLDIHVETPKKTRINFSQKHCYETGGKLDVDMNVRGESRTPVENVFWNGFIPDGMYTIKVNNYTKRENIDTGFTLQVEFDGATSEFSFNHAVPQSHTIECLRITIKNGRLEKISPSNRMTGGEVASEKWGVTSNSLIPVETLMLSPNYWGDQAVGNKHYIFMLKGMKNPEPVRGIYNEFLRNDLNEHRKVFEILGAKTKAEPTDEQLSGVGFSSTRQDEVTVVADGRAYLVKF